MKYLKTYEDINLKDGKYYWKIEYLPRQKYELYAKKLLEKLISVDEIINVLIRQFKNLDKDSPFYIYVTVSNSTLKESWSHTKIESNLTQSNFIYQGTLTLNEQDIEEINREIDQYKYNL